MHRHLIAGALACFGSSLFGQAPDNTADQAQGTLNKIQNSAQNGLQRAQDALDRNVPQISGSSNLGDGQKQSGQSANQVLNAGSMQNNGAMQNMPMTPTWNSSQNNNMQQSWSSPAVGCVYVLRFDANGREFICMNGRPMYFDNVNSVSAQGNSGTQNQYRAGYGNYDLNNGQANSARTTNSSEVASPDRNRLGSDKQNDSKGRQNDLETQSEVDAKPDPVNPSKNSNDKTGPKSFVDDRHQNPKSRIPNLAGSSVNLRDSLGHAWW